MKRILLALAIFALVSPATRSAQAGVDVSVDFFYNNLDSGGNWIYAGDYGYAWQPNVAVSNRSWRPYTDGYWAYTDVGWTWVSNEDFGWATYHYGRWARLRDRGWIWIPGREWGPAWVSWRTGGDHIGWAPLPPRRGYRSGEVVYEGRPINGYVDIDFDIGPAYYNFVDIRYIGGSGLRQRILPYDQNVTYVTNTVNVTNITYENNTVYNHGPDYNRLSAYSAQPIRRLALKRETNVDLSTALKSRAVTKVEGDTLMVAAPQQFKAAGKDAAPKKVETKIEKVEPETGWSGVADEKKKEELQAKMKKEDRRSIPPPDIQPQNPAALKEASQGANPPGAEDSAAADKEKGKDQDNQNIRRRGRDQAPGPATAPAAESTPASDAVAPKPDPMRKGRGNKAAQPPADSEAAKDAADSGDKDKNDRRGRDKKEESARPAKEPAQSEEAKQPAAAPPQRERGAKKKETKLPDMQTSERPLMNPTPPQRQKGPDRMEASSADANDQPRGRGNAKAERQNAPQQPAARPAPPQREQPAARQPRQAAPPQGAPAQGGRPGKERGNKKEKKDKGDEPEG